MPASPVPVVFVHGLWIHSDAWQPWVELYRSAGYNAMAPGWPGDGPSADDTRKNPAAVAGKGIDDITSGYLDVISRLPATPIVIGHSFGGLIAQKLLAGGMAAAAVAIDPGQIKGVKPLPLAQIRSGLPVLSRPGNKKRAVALTDYHVFPDRGHSLVLDHGWREVADYTLSWLASQDLPVR